jgi:hypothetical protein
MRTLILAMFAALAFGAAAKADPPTPGQADCVWRAIPQSDRDSLIATSTSTDDLVAKLQTLAPTVLPGSSRPATPAWIRPARARSAST